MRCVTSSIILLKPDIVHLNTMKSGYKKIGYHGVIGISIDRNGWCDLILQRNWARGAYAPKEAPNRQL